MSPTCDLIISLRHPFLGQLKFLYSCPDFLVLDMMRPFVCLIEALFLYRACLAISVMKDRHKYARWDAKLGKWGCQSLIRGQPPFYFVGTA